MGGEGVATLGRRDRSLGHTPEKWETWIQVSAQLEKVQPLNAPTSGRRLTSVLRDKGWEVSLFYFWCERQAAGMKRWSRNLWPRA